MSAIKPYVLSQTIVENPTATASTATVRARISGVHGSLLLGIAVVYIAQSRRAVSPAGSVFSLYGRVKTELGESVPLSATPINGASGQAAPDGWEGTTTAAELDLVFAVAGVNTAADVGRWDVVVTAFPAFEMCPADFRDLAQQLSIQTSKVVLA